MSWTLRTCSSEEGNCGWESAWEEEGLWSWSWGPGLGLQGGLSWPGRKDGFHGEEGLGTMVFSMGSCSVEPACVAGNGFLFAGLG